MTTIVIGTLVGAFFGVLGGVAGWLVRGLAEAEGPEEREQATEVLAQLHALAGQVARDVGAHNTEVRAISDEISEKAKGTAVVETVARLIQANEAMQSRLSEAEDQLIAQAEQIESHAHEARTDALTGIANRRALDDAMKRQWQKLKEEPHQADSLVLFDVDKFKKFNDTHGHLAGDEVLRQVAKTLKACAGRGEMAARYGGEEFALLLRGTQVEQAQLRADKCRQAIEAMTVDFEGKSLRVTASAGVAQLLPSEDISDWIKRSDAGLYEAKRAGRNRIQWHDGQKLRPLQSLDDKPGKPQFNPDTLPDVLSTLTNRTGFCADVHRRVCEAKRGGAAVSVMLVAFDGHQELKDQYGERVAIGALQLLARFLHAAMRDMDHVARYTESSFGLLLPSASLNDALSVSGRLRKYVERCTLPLGGKTVPVSISLGVAEASQVDDSAGFLQRAEQALKTAGREPGSTCYHDGRNVVPFTAAASIE